jgi:hypothetical protein
LLAFVFLLSELSNGTKEENILCETSKYTVQAARKYKLTKMILNCKYVTTQPPGRSLLHNKLWFGKDQIYWSQLEVPIIHRVFTHSQKLFPNQHINVGSVGTRVTKSLVITKTALSLVRHTKLEHYFHQLSFTQHPNSVVANSLQFSSLSHNTLTALTCNGFTRRSKLTEDSQDAAEAGREEAGLSSPHF